MLVGCAAHNLNAATYDIANATLAVRYDDAAQTFTVTERATGKTFLTHGKFEDEVLKTTVAGQKLLVTFTSGSTVVLELRRNQPFVFVCKELHNGGTATTDIQRNVPVTFMLDLGQWASQLRTMGTGGLLAPDKNPGSYLFLTCADPATRRGVVAGWITEDRGSGVLFSGVKDGKVEFKAQIDYGHLRVGAGKSEKLETLAIGVFDDARLGESGC